MATRIPLVMNAGRIQQLQAGDTLSGASSVELLSVMDARLTLTSGDPVAQATAQSTLYYTPYRGNKIALYDGSTWELHELSEISVAVPSTLFRMFDIFVYDNAGALTLETQNWTQGTGTITGATNATPIVITSVGHGLSDSDLVGIAGVGGNTAPNGFVWEIASVTADTFALRGSVGSGAYTAGGTWYKVNGQSNSGLTTQDGVLVDSGNTSKRYVGIGMTIGTSGQCTCSLARCWLQNLYNPIDHVMTYFDSTSHTYASTTARPWNGSGQAQVSYLVCSGAPITEIGHCSPLILGSASTTQPSVGAGTENIDTLNRYVAATTSTSAERYSAVGFTEFTEGFHFTGVVEQNQGAGTGTYTQVVFQLRVRR